MNKTPGTSTKECVPPSLKREITDAEYPDRRDFPDGNERFTNPTKPRSEGREDKHIPKRADSGSGVRQEERFMGRDAIKRESKARSGGRR